MRLEHPRRAAGRGASPPSAIRPSSQSMASLCNLGDRLRRRRDARPHKAAPRHVVDAGDRNVVRAAEAEIEDRLQRTEGDDVVAADDRGRPVGRVIIGMVARRRCRSDSLPARRRPDRPRTPAASIVSTKRGDPLVRRPQALPAADHGNPPMAEPEQIFGQHARGGAVVDAEEVARQARHALVEGDIGGRLWRGDGWT